MQNSRARPSLEGRKARLALLSQVSSKSPSGSSFMAKVEDPVEVDGKPVLPKGTLVEGHLETTPARRMMRRGALRMIFDRIKLPDGTVQPARFELSATDSPSAKTDSEGMVHPTVSKKRLAIQLGGTALVAKLADDLSEEALRYLRRQRPVVWPGCQHYIPLASERSRGEAQAGRGNRGRFCAGWFRPAMGRPCSRSWTRRPGKDNEAATSDNWRQVNCFGSGSAGLHSPSAAAARARKRECIL